MSGEGVVSYAREAEQVKDKQPLFYISSNKLNALALVETAVLIQVSKLFTWANSFRILHITRQLIE